MLECAFTVVLPWDTSAGMGSVHSEKRLDAEFMEAREMILFHLSHYDAGAITMSSSVITTWDSRSKEFLATNSTLFTFTNRRDDKKGYQIFKRHGSESLTKFFSDNVL